MNKDEIIKQLRDMAKHPTVTLPRDCEALRAAADLLAQPEQEPVAWMKEGWGPDCGPYTEFYRNDEMGWRDRKEWTPLYTTPPQRTWVGLTEEEVEACFHHVDEAGIGLFDFAEAIEAKLKEKNT